MWGCFENVGVNRVVCARVCVKLSVLRAKFTEYRTVMIKPS